MTARSWRERDRLELSMTLSMPVASSLEVGGRPEVRHGSRAQCDPLYFVVYDQGAVAELGTLTQQTLSDFCFFWQVGIRAL
jgi:hypothetical protein